jgi:membrane protein required for colicin V production
MGWISVVQRGEGVAGAWGRALWALVAVLLVLVFDRLIPAGREPEFLKGSQLRPLLSAAGREGLRSLPPDVAQTIDRLKREYGL